MFSAIRSFAHTIQTRVAPKTEAGSSKAPKVQKSILPETAEQQPSLDAPQAANTGKQVFIKKLTVVEDSLIARAFEEKEKGHYLQLCDLQEQRGQLYEKHEGMPKHLVTLCLSVSIQRYEDAYETYEGHKGWIPDSVIAERCKFLLQKINGLKEQVLNREDVTIGAIEIDAANSEEFKEIYDRAMSRGTLQDRVNVCRAMGLNQEADRWQGEYDAKFSKREVKAVPSQAAIDPAEAAYQAALEFFLGRAS